MERFVMRTFIVCTFHHIELRYQNHRVERERALQYLWSKENMLEIYESENIKFESLLDAVEGQR